MTKNREIDKKITISKRSKKILKKMQKTSKKGLTNEKEYGILIGRHGKETFRDKHGSLKIEQQNFEITRNKSRARKRTRCVQVCKESR